LEAITLTGMIEGKRARGRQRKTFMDWQSYIFACGEQWKINNIMIICQDRSEHILIATVSLTRHLHCIGDAKSHSDTISVQCY